LMLEQLVRDVADHDVAGPAAEADAVARALRHAQVAHGDVRAAEDLDAVAPLVGAAARIDVRVAVADQLAAGNFDVRLVVDVQDVMARQRRGLRLEDRTRIQLQVHVAAQVDLAARVDHVRAGGDGDRAARARQRIDRSLDGGSVVVAAVAIGTVVLDAARGRTA
jgi:hypothetical protein